MIKHYLAVSAILPMVIASFAGEFTLHTFKKIQLTDQFWSEGAHYGDFNRDGHQDIVAGPFWYVGPEFQTRHEFMPATHTSTAQGPDGKERTFPGYAGALGNRNDYSDNFFAFTHDISGDGWDDILILGFPGQESYWYENPQGKSGHWPRFVAIEVTDNESPTLADLTGDGKPEIICSSKGYYGYASPDWDNPRRLWTFHRISPNNNYHKYTHGLGFGDVNGDGRADLLEKDGWWEQPESLAGDPVWTHHKQFFGTGGAQMYAYDVDGDGLNDVITSLAAHGYGLTWYGQYREEGKIKFRENTFMNKEPSENPYGVKFSQIHAIDLVDMNQDGLKDIVTGKRFWAHGPTGDPEPGAPAVLYWFELVRQGEGKVDFIPHLIDDDSGVGTQVEAGDVNGDGWLDVVVGNKKGVFVHLHQVKSVTREEWKKAQPKPFLRQARAESSP